MQEMKKKCDMRELQRKEDMFAECMSIMNISDLFTPPTENMPWTTCYRGAYIDLAKVKIRHEEIQFKNENNLICFRDGLILGEYKTDRKYKR